MYNSKDAFVMELLLKDLQTVFDDYKSSPNGRFVPTSAIETVLMLMVRIGFDDFHFKKQLVKTANLLTKRWNLF